MRRRPCRRLDAFTLFVKEPFNEQLATKLAKNVAKQHRKRPRRIPKSEQLPRPFPPEKALLDEREYPTQRHSRAGPKLSLHCDQGEFTSATFLVRGMKQETPSTRRTDKEISISYPVSIECEDRTDKETHKSLSVCDQQRTAQSRSTIRLTCKEISISWPNVPFPRNPHGCGFAPRNDWTVAANGASVLGTLLGPSAPRSRPAGRTATAGLRQ